jgi:cyclomaltodextrinase
MTDFITPEWVHNAVFYQIFPDRFASSPLVKKPNNLEDTPPTREGFKGGDLLGVAEKLDYLQDLGITALYFTPIFQSASNHRYHTHDYYLIDPILGGRPTFDRMINACHQRGIKVVLDGVFNHASRGFFQFNHILELGEKSPYLDWFDVRGYPLHAYEGKPNYSCWWDLPALPKLNTGNPQVREYIFGVARYWVEQGIDGWRLDVPSEIDDDSFWQEFRQAVKGANPDAYITGEIFTDASRWLQGDQFDAVMNYRVTFSMWGFFGGKDIPAAVLPRLHGHAQDEFHADAPGFIKHVTSLLNLYPRQAGLSMLNLLDSHDTTRVLTIFNQRKDLLKLATLFQMTIPGAPCVYYGNEIGIQGGHDPECRGAFPWDEHQWDHDLRGYFKQVIALRRQYAALRTGEFIPLYAQGQALAYLRQLGNEQVVVLINRSEQSLHVDFSVDGKLVEGTVWRNKLGAGECLVKHGHLSGLTVAPFSGAVLG